MNSPTTTAPRTWTLEGTDADGSPETTIVEIVAGEDGGYEVIRRVGEAYVDGDTYETAAESMQAARRMVRVVEREYTEIGRERARDLRHERREALVEVAGTMDGCDALAVGSVARLIGRGKGEAVVAALKAAGLA